MQANWAVIERHIEELFPGRFQTNTTPVCAIIICCTKVSISNKGLPLIISSYVSRMCMLVTCKLYKHITVQTFISIYNIIRYLCEFCEVND